MVCEEHDNSGALFAGPGELPGLCRQFDWSKTLLGPTDRWPASLRAAVRLCLRSRLPMAIWAGPEFVLIYNDGYREALGPDKHPWALGRSAREVWSEDWERFGPELAEVLDHGSATREVELGVLVRHDGEAREASFKHSFTPILEEDGSVVGVLNVLRETTGRVRHERDLQRMFELSHDLLAVAGTDDHYRKINPAFTRVLGWTEEELLERPSDFFVHPDDREQTNYQLGELASGQPLLRFENRYLHKDGSYRWLSWTAAPVSEEGLIYAAARDITRRKEAEERERVATVNAAFRLRLADTLRSLCDPVEIQTEAARLLGEALEASRVHFARVVEDGEFAIVRAEYVANGQTSVIGRHRFDDYGPKLMNEFRGGRMIIVDDVQEDPRLSESDRTTTMQMGVGSYVVFPLVKRHHTAAVLVVHRAEPQVWTRAELSLIEDGAERTWTAIERASAEEALRESEERLRHTLRFAEAGVFEWNIVTDEVYWSPENYELYGVDPSEPVSYGRWEEAVIAEDLPSANAALQGAVHSEKPEFHAEFRVHHPTLGHRWLLCVGKVERDLAGQPLRMRGLNLDITARKLAEEEIRAADQRKTEFLAVLSHELRNPLASIRNSISLLRAANVDGDMATRTLQVLDRQSGHLTRIIDDLLDVTRISRGKIQLLRRVVDLREIVRKTADDLRDAFEADEVELHVEILTGPVWIDADATRIAQVVTNLLHNSLKFTPRGTVTVGVDLEPGVAVLWVRDTGTGMPPEEIPRMFEPFAQADQTIARPFGGLGLGLALVQGLVELHGGEVEARSEGVGRGAEFIVRLPRAVGREIDRGGARERGVAEPRRILVIEDNVDAGQTLMDLLLLRGHDVRLALDGRSGLDAVREFRPEIVICDIGLPDMNGLDLARELRRDDSLRGMKLIALSGYAQPEDRERAREAGFDEHLPKPAPLDRLDALLRADPYDGPAQLEATARR